MEQNLLNDVKLKLKAFEDICHSVQHCHGNDTAHLSIASYNILQDRLDILNIINFDSNGWWWIFTRFTAKL